MLRIGDTSWNTLFEIKKSPNNLTKGKGNLKTRSHSIIENIRKKNSE